MAYCIQCGNQVGDQDQFCKGCGSQQEAAEPESRDFLHNLTNRNAILLCYIPWVGWIAAISVLASSRFRGEKRVQFHAFQGLYLWVVWLLVEWVASPMFYISPLFSMRAIPNLLHLAVVGAWVLMLIKVHQDEDFHLPVIGDLAKRSAAEQRF